MHSTSQTDPCLEEARAPNVTPNTRAIARAKDPSAKDTGNASDNMSFTERSTYLYEIPRSPCISLYK